MSLPDFLKIKFITPKVEKIIRIGLQILPILFVVILGIIVGRLWLENQNKTNENRSLAKKYETTKNDFDQLKKDDQYVINQNLMAEIKNIETTYSQSAAVYENLVDLKILNPKSDKNLDAQFAKVLSDLAKRNFTTANTSLATLSANIKTENDKYLASISPPPQTEIAPANNTAPGNGYSRQTVHTDVGDFVVDLAAAELSSAKVIVDTASDSTCSNNCPALSLGDYVARNNAFAGVNGSYFCPIDYPSCSGKTNSFDLLVMNKNKVYFNSDNNVYSTNPAVIFGSGWVRFVGQALEWGRDTSVDGVISNFPLLVSGHNVVFGGNSDSKMTGKGNRGFVSSIGNKVYIGIVHNVTVSESARTLQSLGMENAMNLDSGGSAAFWFNGYKVGPGRNIPSAILFVRK